MEVTLLGNIVNRYKVNDLAKDFGMQTKQIVEILGKYFDKPKKSGQNLSDHELTVVFEYLTQNNQVSSIQSIYADVPAEQAASQQEKSEQPSGKPEQQKKGGKQQPQQPQQKGRNQTPPARQQSGAPQGKQQQQQKNQPQQAQQQPATSRVPKTKVVDTRKATNVNLDKYDEKLQDMADRSDRSGGRRDREQSKEKFRSAGSKKRGQMSSKRRQEEAEKLRRLQLEIAKKTP